MEKEDLRSRLKIELSEKDDFYKLRKVAINNNIERYEEERFENIHREKILIKDILESCKDIDEKTKIRYTSILEQLEIEQNNLMQKHAKRKNKDKKNKNKNEIER